jgi:hypothetical protein
MKIKLVDGFKIRNTLDIEFGAVGDRSLYPYIKTGEVWLDRSFKAEKDWLLNRFRLKKSLTRRYGYERAKSKMRPAKTGAAPGRCLRELITALGRTRIYLTDGATVRRTLDPNFCFGGHWLVYDYIPKNEVWLDDAADPRELKYILVHELYELELMRGGKEYSDAHDYANAAEKESRRKDGVAKYAKD